MDLGGLIQHHDALILGQILGGMALGAICVIGLNSSSRQKKAWRKFKRE